MEYNQDRFSFDIQGMVVDQPSVEDTISILRGLRERYEVHHGVRIKDTALVAAADNGFRLSRGVEKGWLRFASTTAQGDVWIAGVSPTETSTALSSLPLDVKRESIFIVFHPLIRPCCKRMDPVAVSSIKVPATHFLAPHILESSSSLVNTDGIQLSSKAPSI